ncbi:MAG: GcrA family cell cycle regulator [Pseudomonadota bacterium]
MAPKSTSQATTKAAAKTTAKTIAKAAVDRVTKTATQKLAAVKKHASRPTQEKPTSQESEKKSKNSPWTDDQVRKLAELWGRGWSARDIATALGNTTRNSVIGKLHRLRLSKSKPEKKEATKIRLEDLTDVTCRWPYGDPRHDDFYFCGATVSPEATYCDAHQLEAYQKPRQRNRRASPASDPPANTE